MTKAKLEFSRGETLASKYEIVDLLDESPLGVTYRVKHLKTGKYVRLMLLRPTVAGRDQKDTIVHAFKKAKALSHPHLVKLGELGEHEGVAYYTFEDFDGGTLRDLLQEYKVNGKQFAVKESSQITMQILEGLGAAHNAGMVMRALRPEYVLLNVRYTGPRRQTFVAQTKLVGIAFWDLVPAAVLAEDEFTRGEAQYLAPELKSFEPNPSPRCDIYSTGVLFYEMLVGSAPVGTFQLPKVRRPDLPDHVNDVVELALAQAPDDRYQAANDFINDIQRTFRDAALNDEMVRRPLVTPVGWALALALVAFVGIILFNFRSDPEQRAKALDSQIISEVFEEIQDNQPMPADVAKIYARHPPNMVYVPEGPYVSGRLHKENSAPASEPVAEKQYTKGFLMDLFEFPNLKGEIPRFDVTWTEADRLCDEAGKRLCTEQEWERSCKGPKSTIYSYGDTFDTEFCGVGLREPYRSGDRADCKSGYGSLDLSGNFREWTSSEPKKGRKIVKGGLKGNAEKGTRCAMTTDEGVSFSDKSLSFRCCRDIDAPPVQR